MKIAIKSLVKNFSQYFIKPKHFFIISITLGLYAMATKSKREH